jgi:hypothetical protein
MAGREGEARRADRGGMKRGARLSACLGSVFLIGVSGCATRTEAASPSLRPLENAELAKLFSDTAVGPGSRSSVGTFYYADGRYKIEHGWHIWGTYTIKDNEVCVVTETNQVPFCKRYAKDAAGQVFQVSSRLGDETPREGPPYPKIFFSPFGTDPEQVLPLTAADSE